MNMFEALGKVKDGVITSTRDLDDEEFGLICDLVGDELLTGSKRTKGGYYALKLTEKGEQYLAVGRTPLTDFLPKKKPWWEHWIATTIGGIAVALLIAYLTKIFGWN
ncbi:hypothetical protein [Pseudomonas qingdaonensis]|uniref:hypothetical protein n=1 Tax=Pseudomonas qingdaonensis TaxID=2056231 RepID=UPI000C290261|nr:hypothetical protein [Pseudomonas qingdaonensis]